MKTMNSMALGLAAIVLAGTSSAQTTTSTSSATSPSWTPNYFQSQTSIQDNPGKLGHRYADFHYSWVDYHRDAGLDADGFIAGLSANAPLVPGLDLGIGYDYFRENNHRNPFTGDPYDYRFHQADARATFFANLGGGLRPFLTGGVGYQWSRGDIQRLRTFDHEWVWNAALGVEAILGQIAFTPRVSFTDTMKNRGGTGVWAYGGELHHWFSDQLGGYIDATFHDPRAGGGVEWWTYMAGLRFRF